LAIAALADTLQRIGDDRIDSVILEPILPPTSNHAHVQDTGSQYNDVEGGDGTAHNLEGALHNGTLDTGGLRRSIRLSLLIVVCILLVLSRLRSTSYRSSLKRLSHRNLHLQSNENVNP
jgi:hypothetical protein